MNGNMLTQQDAKGNTISFRYNVLNKLIEKVSPVSEGNSSNTESFNYNGDGTLKTSVDRNGNTTTYTYDIHGRLVKKSVGGISITYSYDENGNHLTVKDATGTTEREYDDFNRVTSKSVPNIGTSTYNYDIIEGVSEGFTAENSTDPKGNKTVKIYDRAGRLSSVTADGKTTTYEYYDNGSRKSVIYPDGSREDYTYDVDGLLSTLTNKKADGSVMDTYEYTHDSAHNQITKEETINGVYKGITAYTYDVLNRLETVVEPDQRETAYTFDASGNRATETIREGENTTLNVYSYDEQNRLTGIISTLNGTQTQTTSYEYDNNGNQTKTIINGEVAVTNEYDKLNQLTRTVSEGAIVENKYNGEGYRVEKTVNGVVTRYLYEYDKVVLEVDGSGNQTGRNIYGTNLLMRTTDGQSYYYMYNGHADVTALINIATGTVDATYYYDAFGNIIESTGDVSNNITYAGYQYDKETGFYYLNARMYDPKIARFLQEDTYRGDAGDPLSLNLYTYCLNNPLVYWDPTGNVAANVQIGDKIIRDSSYEDGRTKGNIFDVVQGLGPNAYISYYGTDKLDVCFINANNGGVTYRSFDPTKKSTLNIGIREAAELAGIEDTLSYWTDTSGKMNVQVNPDMKNAAVQMTRQEKNVTIDTYFEFTGDLATNSNKSDVIKGLNAWEKEYDLFGQNVNVNVNLFECDGKNYKDETGNAINSNVIQKSFKIKITDRTNEYDGNSHIEPSDISVFGLHAGANILKKYWSASNNSHTMHLQFSESLSSEATHEFGHKLGINDEGDIELAPSYLIYGKQYIVPGGGENRDIWYEYRRKKDKNMEELYSEVTRNSSVMREGQGCYPNSIISDYDLMRAWSAFERNKGYIREIGQPLHMDDIIQD